MRKLVAFVIAAAALSVFAADLPPAPSGMTKPTMCNGRYALCIKAPCEKTPDANGLVPCACVIENGWNMGQTTCQDRVEHLQSTYSNSFNECSRTVTCPSAPWAWCYGAQCDRDPKNPEKLAICKCPVITSVNIVLTSQGNCNDVSDVCSHMWSAASPAESKFANWFYYLSMAKMQEPSQPPATACPVPPGK